MPRSVFSATYRRFIKLLVAARAETGVTQTELAQRIGWRQTDISKVERCERRLDVGEFIEIADALAIDASKLVGQLQKRRR
jgi:transcriptional regulator with XRE-family HTH domain